MGFNMMDYETKKEIDKLKAGIFLGGTLLKDSDSCPETGVAVLADEGFTSLTPSAFFISEEILSEAALTATFRRLFKSPITLIRLL